MPVCSSALRNSASSSTSCLLGLSGLHRRRVPVRLHHFARLQLVLSCGPSFGFVKVRRRGVSQLSRRLLRLVPRTQLCVQSRQLSLMPTRLVGIPPVRRWLPAIPTLRCRRSRRVRRQLPFPPVSAEMGCWCLGFLLSKPPSLYLIGFLLSRQAVGRPLRMIRPRLSCHLL
jgi:hypothetical protein